MLGMSTVPANTKTMPAAVYICVGNPEKAKEAMADYLKKWPDRTLRSEAEKVSKEWTDKSIQERWPNDMRLAGMPD